MCIPRASVNIRALACCLSLAQWRSGCGNLNEMEWPEPKARRSAAADRPLGLTRRAEDLEDLLSNSHEVREGAADLPPAGHRSFQRARGGRRRAPPRSPHDAIRQSRRCNGCSSNGRDCRPATPARPERRADKARKPARLHRHLQEGTSRQVRSTGFERRPHRRRQCR